MIDYSKYSPGVRDVIEIFQSTNQFEYNMAFIPFYNRASVEEQISFCNIIIGKCDGKTSKEAMHIRKTYLEHSIKATIKKIKLYHCE